MSPAGLKENRPLRGTESKGEESREKLHWRRAKQGGSRARHPSTFQKSSVVCISRNPIAYTVGYLPGAAAPEALIMSCHLIVTPLLRQQLYAEYESIKKVTHPVNMNLVQMSLECIHRAAQRSRGYAIISNKCIFFVH